MTKKESFMSFGCLAKRTRADVFWEEMITAKTMNPARPINFP
jgi:hypothetical protein